MTQKWKCKICDYLEFADEPPHRCPICKAESSRFLNIPYMVEIAEETVEPDVIEMIDESYYPVLVKAFEQLGEEDISMIGRELHCTKIALEPEVHSIEMSLAEESIFIVLKGYGSIRTDNPERINDEDTAIIDNNKSSDEETTTQNGSENKPDEAGETPGEDTGSEVENEQESDIMETPVESTPQTTEESVQTELDVRENDIILVPSGTTISIINGAEVQLHLCKVSTRIPISS